MAGYVTAVLAFVRAKQAVSVIFLIMNCLQFHFILLLFDSSKSLFLEMCLVRNTIGNLWAIMSHFNALDLVSVALEKW